MGSEKLGTCDNAHHDPHHPHSKGFTCVNWREQPQGEATTEKGVIMNRKFYPLPAVQTEGGEFQELPAANEKAQLRPSSPPATAGTAREQLVEKLAKALWDQDITDVVKQTGRPAAMYAQWPEDSRIQPYCQRTYRQAEAVADIAEAYADQRADDTIVSLNRRLAEVLEAKVALATEVAQLRQERDALKDDWGKLSSDFRLEREARERAEKALRELLEHAQRNWQCKPSDNCAECDIIRPIIERALASLRSSEGAK